MGEVADTGPQGGEILEGVGKVAYHKAVLILLATRCKMLDKFVGCARILKFTVVLSLRDGTVGNVLNKGN